MARSAQVPKQLHGYSLQFIECLSRLLDADLIESVSVEVLDDVALHSEGQKTTLIQTKAGLGDNPVSDGSVELWKTFRNWIDQANSGAINPKLTGFTLYVGATQKGKLCSFMSDAQTKGQVDQAIALIESKFLTSAKKFRRNLGEDIREQLNVVLDAHNRKLLEQIILRFHYHHGSGESYQDLRDKFSKMAIQDSLIELVMDRMAGWVKRLLDEAIEADQKPIVKVKEFHNELVSFHKKLINQPFLSRFANEAIPQQASDHASRKYYRQLQIIEASDNELMQAVGDYLSARAHAVQYLREGTINKTSLEEYSGYLRDIWVKLKKKWELLGTTKNDIHFGRSLLNDCTLQKTTMEGGEVPPFFMCGSFHQLADDLEIGWHPRFLELLGSKNGPV